MPCSAKRSGVRTVSERPGLSQPVGRLPVPAGVWSELKKLIRERRHELDRLVPRTEKAHDAALRRTVEQAKLGKRSL